MKLMKPSNKLLTEKVNGSLEKMRPFLIADGGDVELIKISKEGVVHIKLLGSCKECPYRTQTLLALSEAIKKTSPEVTDVVGID